MDAAQSNHSGIVDFVDFDNVEFDFVVSVYRVFTIGSRPG